MKKYRVGVHYQEGAVLTVLADSPEQAKKELKKCWMIPKLIIHFPCSRTK